MLLGGTGFLGNSLLKEIENKHSIKLMTHNSDSVHKVKKFQGNIFKKNSFKSKLESDSIVLNLVGQLTPNLEQFVNSNIVGGLNLLNSCMKKQVNQIILISSINVYGNNFKNPSTENDPLNPKTHYGVVKMINEKIYQYFSESYGIDISVLRMAGLYGPTKKSGFIPHLLKSINEKSIKPILYHDGKQYRDLIHVNDAVRGIIKIIDNPQKGFQVFNISSGKRYSMKKIVSMIETYSKKNINVKLSSKAPDEKCIWADFSKAKKILNFEPTITLEKGLNETIDYYLKK